MSPEEIYIGSKNTLCNDNINELIKALVEKVDRFGKDPETFIEYHNIYTVYTTLLLFYATGHRPVIDPFCYFADIDTHNRQVLIDDKAISEKHRYRLTALNDYACRQIEQYKKHLSWLVFRLKNTGHFDLCNEIKRVLDTSISKENQALPFLFLLKKHEESIETISLSESVIEAEIKGIWPIKLNQSRHNISSYLREIIYTHDQFGRSLKVSNIEAHLGHMEQLTHPFGKASLQSFSAHKEILIPYLDDMMNAQGWRVINSKKFGSTNVRKTEGWVHKNLPFGPHKREITRAEKRNLDASTVRNILNKYEQEDVYKQEALDRIRDEIVEQSSDSSESINRRLNLLIRFLSRANKKNKKIGLPANYIALNPEPYPFTSDTISEYVFIKELKKSYLIYLGNKGRHQSKQKRPRVDYITRQVEVIISAVLYDSILDKKALYCIFNDSFKVISESGKCFVDLESDGEFYSRWFPGDISLGLLHGLNNDKFINKIEMKNQATQVNAGIVSLLSEFGIETPNKNDPIDFILKKSIAYSKVETPGFLNVIASNNVKSKHLPQSVLLRILRNERIVKDNSADTNDTGKDSAPLILNSFKGEFTYSKIDRFIKELEHDLNVIKDFTTKANKNIERIRRQKLVALINKRLEKEHEYPPIAVCVASWVKKLCIDGTDLYKPMLKTSVIDEYARMIAKSVCYLLYNVKFLDLDADEYEYIYEIALESNNHSDKTKFKNNLTDFHNFLVTSKVADPINWEPLDYIVSSTKVKSNVDANIVSPREYVSALELLFFRSKKDGENMKFLQQCCAMLILGYRFGLRVGEAVHLEYRNIQHDDDFSFVVIHITNNRYRTTKSIAGRRTIPLIGKLSDIEKEVLSSVFTQSPAEVEESNIFVDEGKKNRLIDYSSANRIIKQLLVLITGDKSIRFHHLRHSFANRVFAMLLTNDDYFTKESAYMLNGDLYVSSKEINELLIGKSWPSSRSLVALASLMGHSDISTTFNNYIHVTDMLLNTWIASTDQLEIYNNRQNTDYIVAYCTGALINYVKKGRQVSNLETTDISKTMLRFVNHKRFATSSIKTEKLPDSTIVLDDIVESTRIPDLLDIDSAITLSVFSDKNDYNSIASKLYLDAGTVEKMLETYRSLSNKSSYDGYLISSATESTSRFSKESRRIRSYIKSCSLDKEIVTEKKFIKSGVDVWGEFYYPHHQVSGLVISSPEDFFVYVHFLKTIGIPVAELKAYIPSDLTYSEWYKTVKKLEISLEVTYKDQSDIVIEDFASSENIRHSFTKQRIEKDYRIQLVLKPGTKNDLKYQKTLDRLCFLIFLFFSLNKVKNENI